eukprot:s4409_g2.t1
MRSRSWVVCLSSGWANDKGDPFEAIPLSGKVILEVDIEKSKLWDIHRDGGVYALLLLAAATGRISDVISVPLCDTWPTSMAPRRGPSSYPKRSMLKPYGVEGLTSLQKQEVDKETATVAKSMLLWTMVQMCTNGQVGFILDFPSDEERLRGDDPLRASLWNTELWNSFRSIAGMGKVSFYVGAYGHRAKRPTTMATTYPSILQIDKNYDFHDDCVPPSLLSYKEMRSWPRTFRCLIAEAVMDYNTGRSGDEREMVDQGVKLGKLTKEQREAWQRHLLNDHQPYRADRAVCINAQATGYQHRRRRHPSMYTVALDLAGPFKQKGRDMEHEDYKYIMVAAYRCPKEYLSEKALAYLDSELYVPDEPEEAEGEDPLALVVDRDEGKPKLDPEDSEGVKDEEAAPEVEPEEVCGPETLDDAVEGLREQEEWTTIYITRPMRRRTTQFAAQAAKEIDWTVKAQLRHTKTAGGDPAGNSSAELGIMWAKSRVRALLVAAKAPHRDWPMAINHASSDLWAKAFPDSPWISPPATAFGSEVWLR